MITAAFKQRILAPVRQLLGARIEVPQAGSTHTKASWSFDEPANRIVLELPIESLCGNMQDDLPASPSFLFCLGYWSGASCLLRVTGDVPEHGSAARRHWMRSAFIIEQLKEAMGERFDVEARGSWSWPEVPYLNKATSTRPSEPGEGGLPENILECSMDDDSPARQDFAAHVEPIQPFRRQLPLGLFEGEVRKSTSSCWTPGQKSQLDLWAPSANGHTMHLFELKAGDSQPLGILAQAIFYAGILHHVRVGLPGGRKLNANCENLDLIRAARHLRFWLAAPRLHPLLRSRDDRSPLELLNALHRNAGLGFAILPLETTADHRWSRWCWEKQWPAPGANPALPAS